MKTSYFQNPRLIAAQIRVTKAIVLIKDNMLGRLFSHVDVL
jgi:hypothetical protein